MPFRLSRRASKVCFLAAIALWRGQQCNAVVATFFGEDLQTGAFTTLFPHPQADAARTSFLNNITNPITQNFDSIPAGTEAPISVTFGTTTATITGSTAVVQNTADSGAFATSSPNYVFTTTDLNLAFSQPQSAFGFYGTDIGDAGATSLILTLNNSTSEQVSVPANFTPAANGSVLYFGLIAPVGEQFTGITFANNSGGSDFFGFDDFTIATAAQIATPEATAVPVLSVIAGCVLLARRGKRPSNA